MPKKLLTSLLWETSVSYPNQVYLDGERPYTYAQTVSIVYQLAQRFKAMGIKRWDRVVIAAANSPEVLLTFFAVNVLGGIVTILHEDSTEATLKNISEQLEAKLIVLDQNNQSKSHCLESQLKANLSIVDEIQLTSWEESYKGLQEIALASGTIDTDPALIIYTSGSTGTPRGVVLTQDNILFVIEKIQKRLGYCCEDSIGVFLPLSFDYGLYQAFLAAQVGARLVISRADFAGPPLLARLRQKGINVLPGVPNLFESLLKILERRQETLPEIRLATNTGAHLSWQHIERLQQSFPNASVYPMYGLTECKRVSILTPEELKMRPHSVGRALDDTETLIVDDMGKPLAVGEVGELVVCGRHLALGYWKAPMETDFRYRTHPLGIGRCLYTGDNFKMDEDGYLYFVGRRDEQIKRKGFRIHPLEIEKAAIEIDEVKIASLVQVEEALILFVVVEQPEVSPQQLLTKLGEKLEPYKLPDVVNIVEKLPNTLNGKVDRKALALIYQQENAKEKMIVR